jgi:hypothetical protein
MVSGWETYQGKRYFICRYCNLTLEALKREIAEVEALFVQQPEHSILLLVDVRGTIISTGTFDVLRCTAADMKKYIRNTAILGVTGARRTMLDLLIKFTGLSISAFDRQADAVEWLVNLEK